GRWLGDALRGFRSPHPRGWIADGASPRRTPCGARATSGATNLPALRLAARRPRWKGRISRGQAPRLGGIHSEGRALALPAGRSIALLAEGEGPQGVRLSARRVHGAKGWPPAPRRASRRAVRRPEAPIRREGRPGLHPGDSQDALAGARAAADGQIAVP